MEKWVREGKGILLGGQRNMPIATIYDPEYPNMLNEKSIEITDLIVAAVNACILINPQNPMAVAENIEEMYKVLISIEGAGEIDVGDEIISCCPVCDAWGKDKHKQYCELGQLLSKLEKREG